MARRIITARQQYALLSPWRVAAPLQQRPSRPSEAPPDYRDLWQRPHGLDADFDPFDDLDFDEGLPRPKTARPGLPGRPGGIRGNDD